MKSSRHAKNSTFGSAEFAELAGRALIESVVEMIS
jgi:hypothetical protein